MFVRAGIESEPRSVVGLLRMGLEALLLSTFYPLINSFEMGEWWSR